MRREVSAYAILGLDPDADRADIDRAYKRLIKQHHPDREGGDASRAAEINRAYRELRGRGAPEELSLPPDAVHASSRGRAAAEIVIVAAILALPLASGPVTALISDLSPVPTRGIARLAGRHDGHDPLDQPIRRDEVTSAVRDAAWIFGRDDDAALLNASSNCYRKLRLEQKINQFDRCAAFDDAVVYLENRDPSWDGGPFSAPAVMRRQWSNASALSNDYLKVDGRLDRIRLQVELLLAPQTPIQNASVSAGPTELPTQR